MKFFFHKKISKKVYWKITAFIAACLLVFTMVAPTHASNVESLKGNISWNLNGGHLTISGSGAMQNYTEQNMAPWYDNREQIISVTIADGITTIGDLAFYGCTSLQSVTIPYSVISIGDISFAGCSNLSRVTLGSGLKSIGENAFSRCTSLNSIRFPDSLIHIGYQAFYLCESLSSVRIPYSVSNLEEAVFAYCTSLLQAVVECPLMELPEWTFYGCTSLTNISLPSSMQDIGEYAFYNCTALEHTYHSGSDANKESVQNQIQNDVPEYSGVTSGNSSNIGSSGTQTTVPADDGGAIVTDKEVVDTDNSTTNITVEHKLPVNYDEGGTDEYNVTIDATIENEDGWQEVFNNVGNYIEYPERLEDDNTVVNKVELNVHLKGDIVVDSSVLANLAGHKVNLNVYSGANAAVTIDCENLDADKLSKTYNLNFTITKNENPSKEQKEFLGEAESYLVVFEDNIPFEVTIRLPIDPALARCYASFCEKNQKDGWQILQSVIIDDQGYGYFYLGSLEKNKSYLVGINMAEVSVTNAWVPDSMSDEYGTLMDAEGNRYVLSEAKSTLGITFKQLTLIVVGVIVLCVVVVGVIMFMASKAARKRVAYDLGYQQTSMEPKTKKRKKSSLKKKNK